MSLLPLGYSSNLHAAETVDELIATFAAFTAPARTQLGWDRMGLDLRLGSAAIRTMAQDQAACARVRRALDQAGVSAHTLNAFPLRPFQAAVVKADAYRPDWSDVERELDSIACIDVALALSDEQMITISTVPGSYRPFGSGANNCAHIAAALGRWAAVAAQRLRDTGRRVVLALEPEPWCTLETSFDVTHFWQHALAEHGVAAAAERLGGDTQQAQRAIADHLGICFDTCHFSLAFEDQVAAVARLQAAAVPIVKCQFSAAPEVRSPAADADGIAALRGLAEPRFMHQTAAATTAGSLVKVQDLDQLDICLTRLPNADAVRSHFHIPIFHEPVERGLSTTVLDSRLGLEACLKSGCTHVAVETYTWSILAANERDALAGTVNELQVLHQLVASHGLSSL